MTNNHNPLEGDEIRFHNLTQHIWYFSAKLAFYQILTASTYSIYSEYSFQVLKMEEPFKVPSSLCVGSLTKVV
jgi:hypothetical protein